MGRTISTSSNDSISTTAPKIRENINFSDYYFICDIPECDPIHSTHVTHILGNCQSLMIGQTNFKNKEILKN